METAAHALIRVLLDEYLEMYPSRDDKLTELFSEDFSGFTGGGDLLVKDKERWIAITRQDFAQVKDPIRLELKDVAIQSLSETIAVATSFFAIHLPIKEHVLSRETARLVLIFRCEASGWKITHSSISIPYYLVQDGEVYPLKQLTERNEKLEQLVAERTLELSTAIAKTKILSGMLPICSSCKKIRDDKNYWSEVETYVAKHSEAQFTHGLCPTCLGVYFPDAAGGADGASENYDPIDGRA